MANQDRFRFEPGDEETEPAVQDEELKKRVNRLSQRMSFLTLLLPCLLAIVVYVAYHDLTQRLSRTQSSELHSFGKLAQDIDQKTASLTARLNDIEAALARLGEAPQSIQALQEELRKSEAAVEKIGSAKADKKEIDDLANRHQAALAALGKDVQALTKDLQALAPFREELGSGAALRGEVQALSARLQKLETSLGKDLTGLAGYVERTKSDLEKIKSDVSGLQARKLDREALDLEVLKTKRLYQIALDQEIGRVDKALNTLQRRLEQVEKAFGQKSSGPSLPPLTGGIKEQPIE
jgi:chromosome segregation ATPase